VNIMPVADATKLPPEPKELDEPVRYMSEKLGLSITLRMPRRIIVDGRDVRTPGLRAKFEHGEFITWKKDVANIMDGLLTGRNARRWNRIFQRAPSEREMQIMSDVAKRADAAKKAALADIIKREPDTVKKYQSFSEFQKRRKVRLAAEEGNQTVGMRSLGG
jgi:hypothetical protein